MPLPPELAEFLPEFQSEVREQLRQLENGLLTIEDEVNNQELLKQLMCSIHTIKGSARMMGFMHIGTLAHTMEDVMTLFKGDQMLSTPATVDVLLAGIDLIRSMVGQDPDAEIDISNLVEQLRAVEVAVVSEALLTSAEPSRPADPSTASSETSDQMRVSAARLDELLRLMGELVLIGSGLSCYKTRQLRTPIRCAASIACHRPIAMLLKYIKRYITRPKTCAVMWRTLPAN